MMRLEQGHCDFCGLTKRRCVAVRRLGTLGASRICYRCVNLAVRVAACEPLNQPQRERALATAAVLKELATRR